MRIQTDITVVVGEGGLTNRFRGTCPAVERDMETSIDSSQDADTPRTLQARALTRTRQPNVVGVSRCLEFGASTSGSGCGRITCQGVA